MLDVKECEVPILPRELKGKRFVGYSIGVFGEILALTLVNGYAFQYYVYTIGLDALIVSIGLFIGLSTFSFFAILFGVLEDHTLPGRFGKRKPYMLFSIPAIFISQLLLWLPPWKPPEGNSAYLPTTLYLWGVSILFGISMAANFSAFYSSLPEQAQTEKNRLDVASLSGSFAILGTVVAMLTIFILQVFIEEPTEIKYWQESGQIVLKATPIIGGVVAVISCGCMFIAYLSIQEKCLTTNGNGLHFENVSVKDAFRKIVIPLKHKNNANFLRQTIFYNMAVRIVLVGFLPFLTFVLLLKQTDYLVFFGFVGLFTIVGFLYWRHRALTHGLIETFSRTVFVLIMVSVLMLLFYIPFPQRLKQIIGGGVSGLFVSSLLGGYLFPNPITAALIEDAANFSPDLESKQEAVKEMSGSYFGLNLFALNYSSGIAGVLLGVIFSGVRAEDPVFIILAFSFTGIFFLIGYLFLKKIKLSPTH
jgi:Na+/melibiose symporter-like transporter